MWLPAVVGDKKNLFIAASISTLITKILMLLVSVVLTYFFQENIHPHPFILWSWVGKMFNDLYNIKGSCILIIIFCVPNCVSLFENFLKILPG